MNHCSFCGSKISKSGPWCALCVLKYSAKLEFTEEQKKHHPFCYVCGDVLPLGAYGEPSKSALCAVCQVLNTRDHLAILAFELTRLKLKRNRE